MDTKLKVVGIGYNAMPYTPFRDNDTAFKWGRVGNKSIIIILKRNYAIVLDGSMNEGKHIQIDKKHAYGKNQMWSIMRNCPSYYTITMQFAMLL